MHGDGPMRCKLEDLSQKSGTDGIIFFEGHCENLQEKMQQLDILLMTSDHEGLPMVLLEAMAMETPIIAHATGGIPKLLDNGVCGILVQEQDGAAYSKEIFNLLSSAEFRSKISSNALRHVTENNSDIQNANAYHDLYSEITCPMNPVTHR
ncbi:MAG: glycosyltransferase [Arenicellales bacterium]